MKYNKLLTIKFALYCSIARVSDLNHQYFYIFLHYQHPNNVNNNVFVIISKEKVDTRQHCGFSLTDTSEMKEIPSPFRNRRDNYKV